MDRHAKFCDSSPLLELSISVKKDDRWDLGGSCSAELGAFSITLALILGLSGVEPSGVPGGPGMPA